MDSVVDRVGQDFADFTLCVRRPVIWSWMTPYRLGPDLVDMVQESLGNSSTRGLLPYGLTLPAGYSRRQGRQMASPGLEPDARARDTHDYARRARRYRCDLERGAATCPARDRSRAP
jgi:hypothetical protein